MPEHAMLDNTLRYFAEVAESGSFSAAARSLNVSQPSLSIAVKRLEEQMGAQLLHRASRGVTLTAAGEVLLQRVREADKALRAARSEIEALDQEPRGRFVLGVHESLGAYLLPGFMAAFLEAHPHVDLSLLNDNSREIERAVVDRRVDVGLIVNPGEHPDAVIVDLFSDKVCFVVASRLRRRHAELRDTLRELPLLHVPALRQTQALIGQLESQGYDLPRRIACSSMELVKNLVLDGTGVGILPYRVASHGVARARLALLDDALPSFPDRITLVRRADAPMTRGMRALLDALIAHGASMGALPEELAQP